MTFYLYGKKKEEQKMNLNIVPVTEKNRKEAEKLTVKKNQIHFIESVKECLQEADENKNWEPVCIYDDEKMIGFSMYGFMKNEKNPRVWFDRLLIDHHFQKMGYGRKAVEILLHRIQKEFPNQNIYISAYEDNRVAFHLYESFGFRTNGELDINGEKIMVLNCKKSIDK